jgi:CheY-like chemotaxis protein
MDGDVMSLNLTKVLHLEDEGILLYLMKKYFDDWGGEGQAGWFQAKRLEDGLRIIQEQGNNFEVVIVDLNLEDSWGMATLEALRPCTIAPFVVCTGGDTEEVQARAKELGVYGVIDKGKSYTMDRIRPIILSAYTAWRDEQMLRPLQELNAQVKAATDRRTRKLESYGTKE